MKLLTYNKHTQVLYFGIGNINNQLGDQFYHTTHISTSC